ncbi:hypothetical protein [Stutzerimonas nitrititolerans]|uniref:hypothetical protein n=1 Tax=Stutzerimonas nitrititolerans TaxID=2482751 RepID=UPI0028A292AA|nr:hypothetical protein [Stutzerimonas nitrititolerans]
MTTETYGPAAYRGQALPALPPPIRDKQGLFDTALKWGHYANLDSISEIEGQLMGEAHLAYERQMKPENANSRFIAMRSAGVLKIAASYCIFYSY